MAFKTADGTLDMMTAAEATRRGGMMRVFDLCERCTNSLRAREIPKFSLASGYSLGMIRPQFFRDMTLAEEGMIALIQPVVKVCLMPCGRGRQHQGGIVHLNQMDLVCSLATILPNLPSELEFIILEKASVSGWVGARANVSRKVKELRV